MSEGPEWLAALAVAVAAGVVRGTTGFGGAMVMSPPLALLLGPRLTVPVVLLLESLAAAPMLYQTRRFVRWRVIGPILAAACITVPVGGYVLVSADPDALRRMIALTVIVFALLLLRGWRYAGAQRLGTSVGLGALSGAMAGATSVGAPPVILYLLSGPDPVATTRANLTLYVGVLSLAAIAALGMHDLIDLHTGWITLLLAPGYYGGITVGTKLFSRFNDARFRQFTLIMLIAVAIGILIA